MRGRPNVSVWHHMFNVISFENKSMCCGRFSTFPLMADWVLLNVRSGGGNCSGFPPTEGLK